MKLASYDEQVKHYASKLNKSEQEVKDMIMEWAKGQPMLTNDDLKAHVWGSDHGISLPMKTIIPGTSEKYFLLHNLLDLAKKGTKSVNVRGYIIDVRQSKKDNPRIVLADESGIVYINVQGDNTKETWKNLDIKRGDGIYIEALNIWKPDPQKDDYVYNAGQFSAISRVTNPTDLNMPLFKDVKTVPLDKIGDESGPIFIMGWVTFTKTNDYLGCSNCRKKNKNGPMPAEGLQYKCPYCGQTVTSQRNTIKQIIIGDNSGHVVSCSLPKTMADVNVDLLKGATVWLIGVAEKRDGDFVFRIWNMVKNDKAETLETEYKNASDIAIKWFLFQSHNNTAKKAEFINWVHDRLPTLLAEGFIEYLLKNKLVTENGEFLIGKSA
jgi:hypothetical protein